MPQVVIRRADRRTGALEEPEVHRRDTVRRAWLTGIEQARRHQASTGETERGPTVGTRVTVEDGPDATWDGRQWVLHAGELP